MSVLTVVLSPSRDAFRSRMAPTQAKGQAKIVHQLLDGHGVGVFTEWKRRRWGVRRRLCVRRRWGVRRRLCVRQRLGVRRRLCVRRRSGVRQRLGFRQGLRSMSNGEIMLWVMLGFWAVSTPIFIAAEVWLERRPQRRFDRWMADLHADWDA